MTQISKWFSLCLIAMLAFTVSSFAQEDKTDDEPVVVYDPDEVDGVKGFNKNKIVIGGSGTFGIANSVLFYEISPYVGYRIVDKWIAGIGFNYSAQIERASNFGAPDDIFRVNYFGGRILTRYLLFHVGDPAGIYAQAEFQRNDIVAKFNGEVVESYAVDAKSSMLLGLGYTSNYYQGFGYTAEVFYDALHKDGESFSVWPISYRIGFSYGF